MEKGGAVCVADVVMVKIMIFIQNNHALLNYKFFVTNTVFGYLTLNKNIFTAKTLFIRSKLNNI